MMEDPDGQHRNLYRTRLGFRLMGLSSMDLHLQLKTSLGKRLVSNRKELLSDMDTTGDVFKEISKPVRSRT